jgi:2,4-dienoyl-CoA reductase (NADPH2)
MHICKALNTLLAGVVPRKLNIEGAQHPKVMSYVDVLRHKKPVGKKVAVIGQCVYLYST